MSSLARFKVLYQPLYVLNTPWYTLRAQRVEQVGRSLLETNLKSFIFGLHLNYQALSSVQERKVRTLPGSEPANGGAFESLRFQISDLKFEISEGQRSEI